jgi:hypothetical protein
MTFSWIQSLSLSLSLCLSFADFAVQTCSHHSNSPQSLGFICTNSSYAPMLRIRPYSLLRRDEVSCTDVDSSLPSRAMCPSDSACISLNSATAWHCCPAGSVCDSLATIACDDIKATQSYQDEYVFEDPPQCYERCCPYGYVCIEDNNDNQGCAIDRSTSIADNAPSNFFYYPPDASSTDGRHGSDLTLAKGDLVTFRWYSSEAWYSIRICINGCSERSQVFYNTGVTASTPKTKIKDTDGSQTTYSAALGS